MDKEIRSIILTSLETRETEENSKVIKGYINKFNTRSQYMGFYEEVQLGAFDKTLADGHNIFAMYNHNSDMILGSTRANSLTLKVDDIGLAFELRVNDNISYAKDLYELVNEGTVDGCSFGFYVVDDSWQTTSEGIDLRIIKEIELLEATITPFPAYLDSSASVRSYEKFKENNSLIEIREKQQAELNIQLLKLEAEL